MKTDLATLYIAHYIECMVSSDSKTVLLLEYLMCYERLPEECHRSIVALKIAEYTAKEITIVNL